MASQKDIDRAPPTEELLDEVDDAEDDGTSAEEASRLADQWLVDAERSEP